METRGNDGRVIHTDAVSLAALVAPVLVIGFVLGFLCVRANYVLIVFLGKVFSSGAASWRYAGTGVLASLLTYVALGVTRSDLTPDGRAIGSVLLLGTFALGALIAREDSGPLEFRRITKAVFETVFPNRPDAPGGVEVSAAGTSERLIATMPASSQAAIMLLYSLFDSRTMVLVESLRSGEFRWRRFVHLSPAQRRAYLDDWRTDPRLAYGAHVFRILSSYAFYVKPETWSSIGYDGQLLRDSYLM